MRINHAKTFLQGFLIVYGIGLVVSVYDFLLDCTWFRHLGSHGRCRRGPVQEQVDVYEEIAKGGVGLIITGFTSVDAKDGYFGGMARISDGVQIHAAHGFYLSRFISPAYNYRTDAYGGSVAGRARILTDILADIRTKEPDLHVTMKINCSDFLRGGLSSDDALKTILVGGYRSIECMNAAVNDDGVDMISLSRPLIREPELMKRWEGGGQAPARCVSCNASYRTPGHRCIFVLNGFDNR